MTCRYDRETGAYLVDGEPCRRDSYGDPTHHCTARRTCAQHVGPDELTCARCLGRTRVTLRRIPELVALMPAAAVESGIESEAANLAGPSTHPGAWANRRIAMRAHLDAWERLGRITEEQLIHARTAMEDDDDLDPYLLLGRWDMMVREDYGHPSDKPVTVANAADYLDRQLHRIAQDPDQDFALLGRELRDCCNHLEAQLAVLRVQHRGAPCPECTSEEAGVGPRLVRRYGHWCEDSDCERLHYLDDSADQWVCPRDPVHRWSHEDYSRWIEERRRAVGA